MNGLVNKPQVIYPIITRVTWQTGRLWIEHNLKKYNITKNMFSQNEKKTCVACACRGGIRRKKTSGGGLMKNLIYG